MLNSLLHRTCITVGKSQKIESDVRSNRTAEVDTRSPNTEIVMVGGILKAVKFYTKMGVSSTIDW